jgi:hypothetical protein
VKRVQEEEERKGNRQKASKGEERFMARNWHQMSSRKLNNMPKAAQSRYQAYEPPSKESLEAQDAAKKRILETSGKTKNQHGRRSDPLIDLLEQEHDRELIGQLKAAEARDRLRQHYKDYSSLRTADIQHLIASQPTALEALRLKSFLPPTEKRIVIPKYLNKQERQRCELLLDDTKEQSILRKH